MTGEGKTLLTSLCEREAIDLVETSGGKPPLSPFAKGGGVTFGTMKRPDSVGGEGAAEEDAIGPVGTGIAGGKEVVGETTGIGDTLGGDHD